MKKRTFLQKLCAIFTVSALLLGTGSAIAPAVSAAAEPDAWHDDWLHVNDNAEIVDRNGNPVWLTGCNWFGYNVGSQVFDGVWSQNMHEMLTQIADHGFNLLRIPVSTELLLQWKNGDPDPATPKVNEWTNPELTKEGVVGGTVKYSFDIWNQAIAWCRELGIKIMIDIHSAETASAGHQVNLWYTDKFSTEDWFEALSWFADYYKDDDTILAIDLKNEPHGKGQEGTAAAKWDGSTDENNWAYAATKCANSILDVNPNALIFIEGVEQSVKSDAYTWGQPDSKTDPPYIPAWWGGNLRGVRKYPVVPDSGTSQIVYSPHDYGPSVYNQTWFDKDFTEQTLLDDYWYDTWAYVNAEDIAPLLIGEWGGHMDGGKNQQWMELLRDYMINHHINHTFWCLNTNSGDTGGLWAGIGYDQAASKTNLTWDADKYALFEKSLWQTLKTGKYIGLDHQKALGNNGTGLSLSEFYESYASTEGSNLDGGTIVDGNTTKPTTDTTKPSTTTTTITTTTTAAATTTEAPKTDVLGDINDDQNVTISDLVLLNRYLLRKIDGTDAAYAFDRGDVNGDKILNVIDATLYRQCLLGTLKKFPAE